MRRITRLLIVTILAISLLAGNVLVSAQEATFNSPYVIEGTQTKVEDIAIANVYSSLAADNGTNKIIGISSWYDGFEVTGVEPLSDAKAGHFGYLVTMRATDGTDGYVIVGANENYPPVIEFSYNGVYSPTPYHNYWKRTDPNEATESINSYSNDSDDDAQLLSDMQAAWSGIVKMTSEINTQ